MNSSFSPSSVSISLIYEDRMGTYMAVTSVSPYLLLGISLICSSMTIVGFKLVSGLLTFLVFLAAFSIFFGPAYYCCSRCSLNALATGAFFNE